MKNQIIHLFLSVFFLIHYQVESVAQSVELEYKTKGKNTFSVSVGLSDQDGNTSVEPEVFLATGNLFFTIYPNINSEREYFKESDLDGSLNTIRMMQNNKTVKPVQAFRPVKNSDDRIKCIVMTFSKEDVHLYDPFIFVSSIDTSEAVKISEDFYPDITKYREIYEKGYNLSHEDKYPESFRVLFPVIKDAESNPIIRHYSFFQHLSETVMETIIYNQADSLNDVFACYNDRFQNSLNFDDLVKCDSVIVIAKQMYQSFSPYFEMDFPKSKSYEESFKQMISTMEKAREKSFDFFKTSRLQFFVDGQYNSSYQFRFYIDLIARMLLHIEKFHFISGLDTLNIGLLNKFPDKKNELVQIDLLEDFLMMIRLINTDIKYDHRVFNDSVMSNLSGQSALQHQPYYEIFRAFNLVSQDKDNFSNMLNNAIKTCTDTVLLQDIEMWQLCYHLTVEQVKPQILQNLNKGLTLIQEKKWEEAGNLFEIITKQADNLALSWYYAGKVNAEMGADHLANNRFSLAIEKYPRYISPRINLFETRFEQQEYDQLLLDVNQSLELMDIWMFYYWKAKVHFAKKQYKETIQTIVEKCHPLNRYHLESWFLLGDAYYEMKNIAKAREAYDETQQINPHEYEKYNRIMEEKF